VAITRHGETLGYYVPVRRKPNLAAVEALRRAGEELHAHLEAAGITEEELMADFEEFRRQARQAKR